MIKLHQKKHIEFGLNVDFDVRDKKHPGQPKRFENVDLQELLDENPAQTLLELSKSINITLKTISKRLRAMGKIHKEGGWLPHELSENAILTFVCIGAITLTAIGTMLRGYLIHVCGMFKIASYRIEQAFKYSIKIFDSIENEIMIYKEIICAVDIHCKAIKYSEFLLSSFEGSFLALTVISVICLSLNLFAVSFFLFLNI
ncbi:PREDICTED: uncharacterized protein LOC105619742, partial [Atta cephalotes]|uniref:Uncharacterized protein n=1 Tax=Atta cephalotes TaxID=12957 RepID=A0A158NGJ3_ATTCE